MATHESSQARIGHQAGVAIESQGRLPNEFACRGWYDDQSLARLPQQRTPAWITGYLAACSNVK